MRPTLMRITITLAVLLVVLAACGDDTTAPPTSGDPAPTLDGRTFVGSQVDGHTLAAGSSLRLSFKDGEVGVQAGCNSLFGKARLDQDKLVVDQMGGTEMGCSPELMDQDTWIAAFLQSGPAVTVDAARLVLTKDGTTVTLDDEAEVQAQNPIPLEGTTWELESLLTGSGDEGAASSVPGDQVPTLLIEAGQAQVLTGCNRGRASVEVAASSLTLGPLALTKMACKDSPEQAVLAVLTGEVGYVQEYDVLTLTAADGKSGLQFRARG